MEGEMIFLTNFSIKKRESYANSIFDTIFRSRLIFNYKSVSIIWMDVQFESVKIVGCVSPV